MAPRPRGAVTPRSVTIVSAADANYFDLLQGLVLSLRDNGVDLPISLLDIGLAAEQRVWLADHGCSTAEAGWDIPPKRPGTVPDWYRVLWDRPFLPRYFPGYEIYLWLDADIWVQNARVVEIFCSAAASGKLAIVPEIDRSYWTMQKPKKLFGQNHKAFAYAFGLHAGYRLGRKAILNAGAFAMRGDAPHWQIWADTMRQGLYRPRPAFLERRNNFYLLLTDQTSLNHIVYAQGLPTTFLPAYCNWFCAKGTPMYDPARGQLVEPNAPYETLGAVHLAGRGVKTKLWQLPTTDGGSVETRITYEGIKELNARLRVPA
jgi:hypothetical protein